MKFHLWFYLLHSSSNINFCYMHIYIYLLYACIISGLIFFQVFFTSNTILHHFWEVVFFCFTWFCNCWVCCVLIGFLVCFNIYLGIVHLFLNYTLIIYDRFDLITFIGCVHNIGQLVFLGGMGVAMSSWVIFRGIGERTREK